MTTNEQPKKITADFLRVLSTIQNKLIVEKGQYNSFSNFYYRSCEDILAGLKPLLFKYQSIIVLNDEIVNIKDRYYIKATAKIINEHGEMQSTAYARESEQKKGMDASQISGSASSYARKYSLNALFLIDDQRDADTDEMTNTASNHTPKSNPESNYTPSNNYSNDYYNPNNYYKQEAQDELIEEPIQTLEEEQGYTERNGRIVHPMSF